MSLSDKLAGASLLVGIVAFILAFYAILRANKTSSAATMVALNEGFRAAWARFLGAKPTEQENELAELLNLFEIACAIRVEGSLSGNSAILISEYLDNVLRLLISNDYTKAHTLPLIQDETTFLFIKKYLRMKAHSLSITIPLEWYQV